MNLNSIISFLDSQLITHYHSFDGSSYTVRVGTSGSVQDTDLERAYQNALNRYLSRLRHERNDIQEQMNIIISFMNKAGNADE